ncbi:MAG: hypothetical protein IE891_11425 [Flavobacteriaceae bacterium]|nr:hypothetical protein [Flavobacteriaceae bacterium]
MKNLILTLSVFTLLSFSSSSEIKTSETVYVCGKSDVYHPTRSHSALDRCKSGITEMSEKEAINAGKRKCKCRG